jgi:hypothetical protein
VDSPTAQQFPQEYLGAKVKKDISDDISDVDVAAKASEDIISQEEIAAEANEEAVVKMRFSLKLTEETLALIVSC